MGWRRSFRTADRRQILAPELSSLHEGGRSPPVSTRRVASVAWTTCSSALRPPSVGDALSQTRAARRGPKPTLVVENSRRSRRGYTLLEVLIVVAVVTVLAAIALPSYTNQLRRFARAEAQSFLTKAAATQQQFLIDRRSYAGNLTALNVVPPAELAGKYTFAVATAAGPPPTFTLTATATGLQAQDACPTLTVDSRGSKSPNACW